MANEPSKETIKVGDYATIYGDVFTGGKHIYYNVHRPPIGTPFQAPPLPAHFVPRPEVTDAIKTRLLADKTFTPGILVVSAIHGLGGIGKSTLAAALAYDPEVQARFNDGILWATLGQQPDLLSLLSGWIQTLGDYDFRPTTIEAASTHLRTLLQDKATLLVVDDVWEPEHALPFRVGGPQSQVLITTRRADVAEEVGAELHQLDVMTPEQSLNLLTARLGRILTGTDREEALQLAKAVGHLPLALELAAARVARGIAWNALCEALEEEVARLEALESPRRRRGVLKLEASFNLSLNTLRIENEEAWQAFVWLGVLPEDVRIAAPMASTLWEMNKTQAVDMLEFLWNDALLLPAPSIWVGDRDWPAYRLHDLLHDIARRLLTSGIPDGLGMELSAAHSALLECYKKLTTNNLWHTLADDGYIHAYLTWHMEQAGQIRQIDTLLREETSTGQNAWYEAQEQLGEIAGYLTDINRAWNLAQEEFNIHGDPLNVGYQCRYALIAASIKSRAKNIPPILLATLVEKGLWTPVQGLAYAQQTPDSEQQAWMLTLLAPFLRFDLLLEAYTTAQSIRNRWARVNSLIGLVPYLPKVETERVLQRTFMAMQANRDEDNRVTLVNRLTSHVPGWAHGLADPLEETSETLTTSMRQLWITVITQSAPTLPVDLLEEMRKTIQGVADKRTQIEMLMPLIPYLPEKFLATINEIKDELTRGKVLTKLGSHVPAGMVSDVLKEARVLNADMIRGEVLAVLMPRLSDTDQEQILQKELTAARTINNRELRIKKLMQFVRYLPEETVGLVFQELREIDNEEQRIAELILMAPPLPPELLKEVLNRILSIKDNRVRMAAIVELAPNLSEVDQKQSMKEALKSARAIGLEQIRVPVLVELVPYLEISEQKQVLREALEKVLANPHEDDRSYLVAELVPHLPEELLREALLRSLAINDQDVRARALAELGQYSPRELIEDALEAARKIEDNRDRARLLARLARHLPEPEQSAVRREVRQAARNIFAGFLQPDQALSEILARSPSDPDTLEDAHLAAQLIDSEWARAGVLAGMAPQLAQLPVVTLYPIWCNTLPFLANRIRADLLVDLMALTPVIDTLGGSEAIVETFRAIQDVGRWWP